MINRVLISPIPRGTDTQNPIPRVTSSRVSVISRRIHLLWGVKLQPGSAIADALKPPSSPFPPRIHHRRRRVLAAHLVRHTVTMKVLSHHEWVSHDTCVRGCKINADRPHTMASRVTITHAYPVTTAPRIPPGFSS